MADFQPLDGPDFNHLSPEELVAYHHAARRAGNHAEAQRALGVLLWGFEGRVRFWVSRNAPAEEVDDLVQTVFESALRSSFDGQTIGEFGSWLRTISHRRVADFLEGRKRAIQADPLVSEHEGEEEIWGETPSVADFSEDVVEESLVKQALDELTDVHRRVVEIGGPKILGFEQAPAKETARRVNDQFSGSESDPMTDVNVHQILSRFRKRLDDLREADNPEEGDG
jgi:RNA polymerase sigma factor (sigma-70 family)